MEREFVYCTARSDTHYISHTGDHIPLSDMQPKTAKIFVEQRGDLLPSGFNLYPIKDHKAMAVIRKTRQDIGAQFCVCESESGRRWILTHEKLTYDEADKMVKDFRKTKNKYGRMEYKISLM